MSDAVAEPKRRNVEPAVLRVVLVGTPAACARLRTALAATGLQIAGEARHVDEAHDFGADALVVATEGDERPSLDSWPLDREADDPPEEPLTRREIEVLELVAEGLPNKAIAARLSISDQTVKFHVSSICGKLGAANRTEAVRRALRRGLVTL